MIISGCGISWDNWLTRMLFFGLRTRITITTAANIREISVGIATPSTPIRRPNTQRALPATLMAFIARETFMETLEFPMDRNSAAPEL